ncbi:hypothetical protein BY996DRAFT_6507923 [Phakopsora pachyrhizi]|nr:hypothetical protein BY996DRAFT_6507923 [Phakopsora pachyrhizi]
MNNFEKLPAHELKAARSLTKSDSEIKALGDASKLRAKKSSGRIRVTLGDLIVGDNDRPNLNLIKDGAHQIITITFLERQTRFIGTKLNTSLNKQTSWEAKRTAMPKGKNGAELRKTFQNLYSSNYPNTSNESTRSKASQPKALQEALDLNDSLRREENFIGSEEPQPSNQTTDPESIDNQSEFTAVSILSSQQMTVVNLQSNLQNSSSSSLPVSLRLPLSPTTRSRLTPKSKSTNTTKPTAIRPHTPDLTNSRPKSPSQINLANLAENWGGGGPSELSYGLPDPPSPISAFEINLSTQSNDSQSSLNHSLNQDQRCPMYHQPKTVDPKPLPNYDLPQRTLTIQALPPSEHPESNRSNTPGQSWPENLPNHQLSSKLEIEHKDEDSEEEDTDDDF